MILLTGCQDHMLTENIWFVWSKTSYIMEISGDVTDAGRTNEKQTREDSATQPLHAGWLSFAS